MKSFTLTLDDQAILKETNELEYNLALEDLSPGIHSVSVKANGVGTRYELSFTHCDKISEN